MSFRFKFGDLNPALVQFSSDDPLSATSMSQMGNGYSYTFAAAGRTARPNTFRKNSLKAVLAEVFAFGQEQGSFAKNLNFNLDPKDVKSNRVAVYWARIPEHSYQIDIYAPDLLIDGKPNPDLYPLAGHKFYDYKGLAFGRPDILPGSIIKVRFLSHGDSRMGVIEGIPSITGQPPLYSPPGTGARGAFGSSGRTPIVGSDPGNCPWSSGVQALETVWESTNPAYERWNGTKLRNGLLEETGMLVTDSTSGAQLVPPAMDDFLKLAAAYATKFPGKTLKGSGYRPYEIQVNVRVLRITSASPCGSRSEHDAAGNFIGLAATPGTSNHGWGAAVDIDRGGSGWTNGQAGASPEFQWINKFSQNYNFVFGVTNEHWHIDWMPFSAQTTGGIKKTAQKPWTNEGRGDSSITLT